MTAFDPIIAGKRLGISYRDSPIPDPAEDRPMGRDCGPAPAWARALMGHHQGSLVYRRHQNVTWVFHRKRSALPLATARKPRGSLTKPVSLWVVLRIASSAVLSPGASW